MSTLIYNQGTATVTVPATGSITVWTRDQAVVRQLVVTPNQPPSFGVIGTALAGVPLVLGPFTNATQLEINGSAGDTFFSYGISPAIGEILASQYQATPVALNATGAVTAAAIFGGILTSTTGAAVAGTVPTGAVMDAASNLAVGDSFDWSIINTGGNTFTLTAAANHTIVGTATVVTVVSGLFRTVKTAAGTFITYRLS